MLRDAGYGVFWALAMSITIYAGSMQYVGVSLIAAPASLLNTIITTFIIQARHLFYSISMIGKYRDAGPYKPYLAFALTDETYALLSHEEKHNGDDKYPFCFLVSLFNQLYWITGGVLGSLFANTLPFDTAGVSFSMTALFIAAYTEQWLSGKNRFSSAIGIIVTLFSRILFGTEMFLIPALIIITGILLLHGKKAEVKEEQKDAC